MLRELYFRSGDLVPFRSGESGGFPPLRRSACVNEGSRACIPDALGDKLPHVRSILIDFDRSPNTIDLFRSGDSDLLPLGDLSGDGVLMVIDFFLIGDMSGDIDAV